MGLLDLKSFGVTLKTKALGLQSVIFQESHTQGVKKLGQRH
jgi:hypothetical protein